MMREDKMGPVPARGAARQLHNYVRNQKTPPTLDEAMRAMNMEHQPKQFQILVRNCIYSGFIVLDPPSKTQDYPLSSRVFTATRAEFLSAQGTVNHGPPDHCLRQLGMTHDEWVARYGIPPYIQSRKSERMLEACRRAAEKEVSTPLTPHPEQCRESVFQDQSEIDHFMRNASEQSQLRVALEEKTVELESARNERDKLMEKAHVVWPAIAVIGCAVSAILGLVVGRLT